jgi:CBS domain-containing protein
MNCQECLEELSTASLREMPADSSVMQHCATCPDCARLTTSLREREYEAATLLNNLPPLSNPLSLAEASATLSRRRRVGRVVVTISRIVAIIIVGIVGTTMVVPALRRADIFGDGSAMPRLRTETILLTCLSPEQAADIINPYVRSHGSTYYTPTSGISAITVRGTGEELGRSRAVIEEFEADPAAACHRGTDADVAMQKAIQDALKDAKPAMAGSVAEPTPSPTKRK